MDSVSFAKVLGDLSDARGRVGRLNTLGIAVGRT